MEHIFTTNIKSILDKKFGKEGIKIFDDSPLLQFINIKTRSANKGSKSRGSFGTLYSIYVIIEDYLEKEFDVKGKYADYEGAIFSTLLFRARQLPFGNKTQNHSFNNRVNKEFNNKFHNEIPVIQNTNKKYWINENLLKIKVGKRVYNIADAIIDIINEYASTKQDAFQRFIKACEEMQKIENSKPKEVIKFITSLLAPNVDARLFEIISYSILKFYYYDQHIFWGFEVDNLTKDNLKLFKTGRTNANDGGIDFVMQPLGRFFQVTETLDFKKYFLDIDKIQKFPITFVIKSDELIEVLLDKIKVNANKIYVVNVIIDKYMSCIEEVINIPILKERFMKAIELGYLKNILIEIINQSNVEFNQ